MAVVRRQRWLPISAERLCQSTVLWCNSVSFRNGASTRRSHRFCPGLMAVQLNGAVGCDERRWNLSFSHTGDSCNEKSLLALAVLGAAGALLPNRR
jgi:hypothetical protein